MTTPSQKTNLLYLSPPGHQYQAFESAGSMRQELEFDNNLSEQEEMSEKPAVDMSPVIGRRK